MKKILFALIIVSVFLFATTYDKSKNIKYINTTTKESLEIHYEMWKNSLNEFENKKEVIKVNDIKKIYTFDLPIYKIEFSKLDLNNSKQEIINDIDYVEVDNSNYIDTITNEENKNAYVKYFKYFKLIDFEKTINSCDNDIICIKNKLKDVVKKEF